ncbi:MAG TPA: lamin tail domain-containing protein [Candidatus Microsaccharimonas sp.]|nr:lamin tail domain-containing protein [Candidatus Microsaccharimonas sp.]
MNRAHRVVAGVASLLLLCALLPANTTADTPAVPILSFREVKISGDEFIVVQANQAIADLSSFWLGYSSADTATNIVPTQQLPAIGLAKGQAVLLTSDAAQTCDAVYTSKLSVSLSDTKGALQLRQLVNMDSNTSTFTTIDSVNWTKPSTTDKTPVTDNLDLRRETGITLPVWYHDAASTSGWTVGNFANCSLSVAAAGSGTVSQTYAWPATSDEPPAVILNLSADDQASDMPSIPASDIGLMPPQITELLPNPTGTGTDGTDEFIELYNPNPKPFDLSGFVLETGSTTKHSYTFPAGTSLPPNSFVAFYSAETGLSLSNTSGASDLLDPLGALLTQTNQYGVAKDGQSWSLAKGTWYWTLQPTPGKANSIAQVNSTGASSKASASKSSAQVKGASTTTAGAASSSAGTLGATAQVSPVHPWTLAVVAVLALAYGLYEYRLDMANFFHRFKRHRALSRAHG